jgi:hypothetical protein
MPGVLRIVPPSEGSVKSHRVLVMRKAPSQSLLEDLVGGKLLVIPGLDTLIRRGKTEPCVAFRAHEDEDLPANDYANWLWLQARLREGKGFAVPANAASLKGTIVIVSGDDPFLKSFIWEILLGPRTPEDGILPSEPEKEGGASVNKAPRPPPLFQGDGL